jgi:hypothetical protein
MFRVHGSSVHDVWLCGADGRVVRRGLFVKGNWDRMLICIAGVVFGSCLSLIWYNFAVSSF